MNEPHSAIAYHVGRRPGLDSCSAIASHGPDAGGGGYYNWKEYSFTPIPANGWRFARFEVVSERVYKNSSTSWEEQTYDSTVSTTTAPYLTRDPQAAGRIATKFYDWEGDPISVLGYDYQSSWKITAVFVKTAGGDLPVYDDASGRIVFDDSTGRVVYAG